MILKKWTASSEYRETQQYFHFSSYGFVFQSFNCSWSETIRSRFPEVNNLWIFKLHTILAACWGIMLLHAVPLYHKLIHTRQTTFSSTSVTHAVCAAHSWAISVNEPHCWGMLHCIDIQVTLSLLSKSTGKIMTSTSYKILLFKERVK